MRGAIAPDVRPIRMPDHARIRHRPETIGLAAGPRDQPHPHGALAGGGHGADGRALDLDEAAAALADYARAGFATFDMADHYGSAEFITGRCSRCSRTTGCRAARGAQQMGAGARPDDAGDRARRGRGAAAIGSACRRIDVLQLHWWQYENPGYLDAMAELAALRHEGLIGHLGLTNFDTAHLRVLVKSGFRVATNQVCFSLLDRRAAGDDERVLPRQRRQAAGLRHARGRLPLGALAWRARARERARSPTGAR